MHRAASLGTESLVLLVDIIGSLATLIQFGQLSMSDLALLYITIFTPASYVCWFRPIYTTRLLGVTVVQFHGLLLRVLFF